MQDIRDNFTAQFEELLANQTEIRNMMDKQISLIEYKITQLSQHIEKHNQVVERMYKAESDITVLQQRESVSEHRIDDLEKKV